MFLGAEQLAWLKRELMASNAVWKVLAADMPLGLIVHDVCVRRQGSEAIAQGDGLPLGRELEIASLLSFIKHAGIRNTVWLTADVHYTAAHLYDPAKARFTAFAPFWEFVSGPLHAGSFGPNALDDTFGPLPNAAGRARQVMVWTQKECSASKNVRSSRPLSPRRERQARNT